MIEIVNRQRKSGINTESFQIFAEIAVTKLPETNDKDFTLGFVSDRKMRELNRLFRGKNKTTDVLSFPSDPDEFEKTSDSFERENLGDIIISVEQAERQAKENHLDLETEIKQLILHGILHLCGYDHEHDSGEMNALELKLRDKLKIN